jgi:hypothetical protein
MGENKMAPEPVRDGRVVEEPAGFDQPPTDRIPAVGDLPHGRPGVDGPDGRVDDRRDESVEPVTGPDEPLDAELDVEPMAESGEPGTGSAELPAAAGFFDESAVNRFRDRWRELQADFVDDPARAVRSADELVDEAMRELAERKRGLAGRWSDGEGDTGELRVAMREYRSFFDQLLNA